MPGLSTTAHPSASVIDTQPESALWPRFVLKYVPRGRGRRQHSVSVFLVEDEYLILRELADAFSGEGAEIVGTSATIEAAWDVLRSDRHIDLAVLDINLRGRIVYPLADALRERGIRIAFVTGYACTTLPARFAGTPCFEKPISLSRVAELLSGT